MSSSVVQFIFAAALVLRLAGALPQLCRDADDCEDKSMHPDLPPSVRSRSLNNEDTKEFWMNAGKRFVQQQENFVPNTEIAKNVILFLGDGMSLTTLAATRNYIGGEEKSLSFEKFSSTGLSKTYAIDRIVADSACTATAYLCGVKAMYGTVGVNGQVVVNDCEASKDTANHVFSIAKWAMDSGKSAGVVTTTRITHASPAGVYAHSANRHWENDKEVTSACGMNSGVEDIAHQLIHGEVGKKLKVMMGGGKNQFIDSSLYDGGLRTDGRNLLDEYKNQSSSGRNVYVETKKQLKNVDLSTTDRLLGLFSNDHLTYHLNTTGTANQPTLEEMTRKAIEFMQKDNNGYFLFIEGGTIDIAHHFNKPKIAVDETAEFSKAVARARKMTSTDDTLIVVTSDHSHTFSISGYSDRGSDIFGEALRIARDGHPYLTLSYANGPSFQNFFNTDTNKRYDPTKVVNKGSDAMYPSTVPLPIETHGGEDVPVFASGPWSHLFTGVYEQNTIPHLMAYASCVGDGLKACQN